MRETIACTIKSQQFKIKHLKASSQRKVLRRLLAAAAPLAAMGDGGDADMGKLVSEILAAMTDDDLDTITNLFAEETKQINAGAEIPLTPDFTDDLFAGAGMSLWLEWMRKCIDHNFAGFFVELRTAVGEAVRAVADQGSESLTDSTGTSTG
tara:strand:+ start:77 stop:532 length:456 start_codon:yes stop_codon:yes gene_type:complete